MQINKLCPQSKISTLLKIVRGPLGAPKARGPLGVALTPTTVRYATDYRLQLSRKGSVISFYFKYQRARVAIATLQPGPDRACVSALWYYYHSGDGTHNMLRVQAYAHMGGLLAQNFLKKDSLFCKFSTNNGQFGRNRQK